MILPDLESRSGKKQGYGSESTKKIILGYLCLEVKFAVFKLSKLNFTIFVKSHKNCFLFKFWLLYDQFRPQKTGPVSA